MTTAPARYRGTALGTALQRGTGDDTAVPARSLEGGLR